MIDEEGLEDSWFDLPVVTPSRVPSGFPQPAVSTKRAPRDAESAELDESWFDRPGGGIRRDEVLSRLPR